jgi:UDP-glucose 4-epimerase
MEAWVFRFANVIGNNSQAGVCEDFYRKLQVNSLTLEILGDGKQEKSFLDVDDCINGIMDIPYMCPFQEKFNVFNLANKDIITIKRLAEVLCNELGVNPEFTYTGTTYGGWLGDIPQSQLEISSSLQTGWSPALDCEGAIRKTANMFKRRPSHKIRSDN